MRECALQQGSVLLKKIVRQRKLNIAPKEVCQSVKDWAAAIDLDRTKIVDTGRYKSIRTAVDRLVGDRLEEIGGEIRLFGIVAVCCPLLPPILTTHMRCDAEALRCSVLQMVFEAMR